MYAIAAFWFDSDLAPALVLEGQREFTRLYERGNRDEPSYWEVVDGPRLVELTASLAGPDGEIVAEITTSDECKIRTILALAENAYGPEWARELQAAVGHLHDHEIVDW